MRPRLDEGFTQPPKSVGPTRHTWWLTTVNADGSPHVMPLGVLWLDGALAIATEPSISSSRGTPAK